MRSFVFGLSINNVLRQKSRSWGVGLVTGICTLALICVFFYTSVITEQLTSASQQISSFEQEEKLEGASDWQAQQSGSLSENISAPLMVALGGMKLLLVFLWITALVEVSAIVYVILPERYRELGMYRMMGCSGKKIVWLLVMETCNVSVLGSMAGGALGLSVLWLGGVQLVNMAGLPDTSVTVFTILPQGVLAVVMSALIGPVVSLFLGSKVSQKEILFLLHKRK